MTAVLDSGVQPAGADPAASLPNAQAPAPAAARPGRHPLGPGWTLWTLLVALVVAVLVTLVWLAGRYEASQVQAQLDRDAAAAAIDIRASLTRNAQSLLALQAFSHGARAAWQHEAESLLRTQRELVRIEQRDTALNTIDVAESPYRPPVFSNLLRPHVQQDVQLACAQARRQGGAAYSISYFVTPQNGSALEVMDLCLPQLRGGELGGYIVATYSLQEILASIVGPQMRRSQEVSFIEPDGTRLALHGHAQRGIRTFTSQQILDLPGNTIMLRMDSWRAEPDLFPNVMTALVTLMSITLVVVVARLVRDMRRRVAIEHDLADALAFRKAMEDSLVTGLRARDLQGRLTYVNPAFCEMVGFTAEELMVPGPPPYWPPELAGEYRQRQEVRLAGLHAPPREGYETVYVRKDGSRFPVLVFEAPLIAANGVQTGWMSAFMDISEQRRIEELSRASQERLQATARLATVGEMASLLSHELNQPLAAIASYATGSMNLLQDGQTEGLHVALERIAQQAERAGKVIRSVHDFVRRRDQARRPVAPRELVEAVMPLVSLQARKLGVAVLTRVPPGLPRVLCDRTMVEQVLLNLARNAMQAMAQAVVPRPALTLQARRVGPGERGGKTWVEFAVVDVGPGISPQVQQQLFTPFFTTKAEGMGLGLSLCRTVVEQHGGVLTHEHNQPSGTIFRFTLPAADEAGTPPAAT